MSIHIAPAFKLRPDVDLFAFSEKLRAFAHDVLPDKYCSVILKDIVDSYIFRSDGLSFGEFFLKQIKFLRETDAANVSLLLTSAGVIMKNPVSGDMYVLLSGFNGELSAPMLEWDEIEGEFDLHTSSDSQLKYLSQEEWDARKLAWHQTYPVSVLSANTNGLKVEFFSRYESKDLFGAPRFRTLLVADDFAVNLERKYREVVIDLYLTSLSRNEIASLEKSFGLWRDSEGFLVSGEEKFVPLIEDNRELFDAAVTHVNELRASHDFSL